jgi:hypothetical protein
MTHVEVDKTRQVSFTTEGQNTTVDLMSNMSLQNTE